MRLDESTASIVEWAARRSRAAEHKRAARRLSRRLAVEILKLLDGGRTTSQKGA